MWKNCWVDGADIAAHGTNCYVLQQFNITHLKHTRYKYAGSTDKCCSHYNDEIGQCNTGHNEN